MNICQAYQAGCPTVSLGNAGSTSKELLAQIGLSLLHASVQATNVEGSFSPACLAIYQRTLQSIWHSLRCSPEATEMLDIQTCFHSNTLHVKALKLRHGERLLADATITCGLRTHGFAC